MNDTTVPLWTGVPVDGVLVVSVPSLEDCWPLRISTAMMSVDPFTGSTLVVACSAMTVPDGAVSGTLVHAPWSAISASRLLNATATGVPRAVRSLCETMRATKDTTFTNMDGQATDAGVCRVRGDRSRLDDGGYILVAMLISIAIASVWMAALLPSWRQQVIRERETELIFRGQQYARAIRLYQQQMGGALPSSLDDLVSQHVLRHKWKDPITGDEFLPRTGCLQIGVGGGFGGNVGGPPGTGNLPGGAVGRGAGQPQLQQRGQSQPPGRGQQPGALGLPAQGGICGVQSKSNATSIKIYNGQQQYDLWQFDTATAALEYQRNIVRLGGGVPGQGVGLPVGGFERTARPDAAHRRTGTRGPEPVRRGLSRPRASAGRAGRPTPTRRAGHRTAESPGGRRQPRPWALTVRRRLSLAR